MLVSDANPPPSVDSYLSSLPPAVKAALEDLRAAIKAAAPQAQEIISYRIPTYKYQGSLVHFMAFPKHLSFITVSKTVVDAFKQDLKGYKVSGTTIRFTSEKPLSAELVTKIVKMRMAENEANRKVRDK